MAREEKAKVVDPEATTRTGRFGTGKSDLYAEVRNPNAKTRVEKAEARGPLSSSSFNEAPNNTKTISIPEHEAKREGKHMSVLSSGGIDENDVPAEGRYQPKHMAYEPKHMRQEEGEGYANGYAGKHAPKPTTTDFILAPSTPNTPTTSTRRANQEQNKAKEEAPVTNQAEAKKEAVSVSEKKGYEPEEGKIDIEEAENPGTEKTENDLEKNNAESEGKLSKKEQALKDVEEERKANKTKSLLRTSENIGKAFEAGSGIGGVAPSFEGNYRYIDKERQLNKKENKIKNGDYDDDYDDETGYDPLKDPHNGTGTLDTSKPKSRSEKIKRSHDIINGKGSFDKTMKQVNETYKNDHNRNYQEEAKREGQRDRNQTKGLMG